MVKCNALNMIFFCIQVIMVDGNGIIHPKGKHQYIYVKYLSRKPDIDRTLMMVSGFLERYFNFSSTGGLLVM